MPGIHTTCVYARHNDTWHVPGIYMKFPISGPGIPDGKPVLYVIPIQTIMILIQLHVVPVSYMRTIPNHLQIAFPFASGDRKPGSGDGCPSRMCQWFVNSWALGWSSYMWWKGRGVWHVIPP